MTPAKVKWLEYGIATIVGLVIVLIYVWATGTFTAVRASDVYKNLSNACLISGGFAVGGGLLVYVANQGGFMGLRYGVEWTLGRFIQAMKAGTESYHDFRQRHSARPKTPWLFLVIVGGAFLLLSLLFLILFYTVYDPSTSIASSEAVSESLLRLL